MRAAVVLNKGLDMDSELEKYCYHAIEKGIAHAEEVDPKSVVTAPWVRLKCQFGCPRFNTGYCCPPHTPTPEQTRQVLDSYKRAILFHLEFPHSPGKEKRGKRYRKSFDMLVDLEGEMFKDGYYKALVFLAGPCSICQSCAKLEGKPCNDLNRARPSMESCGIDVYATARNNGFFIKPLHEKTETQNGYCLMLVD